jgi:hypothetical protein
MTELTNEMRKAMVRSASDQGMFLSSEEVDEQMKARPIIEQDGLKYQWFRNSLPNRDVTRDAEGKVHMTSSSDCDAKTITHANCILGPVYKSPSADKDGYSKTVGIYKLIQP